METEAACRRSPSFRISTAAILALGIGFAISGATSAWLRSVENREQDQVFQRHASVRMATFEHGLDDAVQSVITVNRLFANIPSVSRRQFRAFAQPLLQRYPYIYALMSQRLVSAAERPAYEAEMRKTYPWFAIVDIKDGTRVAAGPKARYRVIDYVEPMEKNKVALGVDASSIPYHEEAIRTATDTGAPASTELFPLLPGQGVQRGFVVVMPVYRRGAALNDSASRRAAVIGFTAAVFRTEHMMQNILRRAGSFENEDLELRVYSGNAPDDRLLAFRKTGAPVTQAASSLLPQWLADRRPASMARTFEAAGRQWHMVVSTAPGTARGSHVGSWLALLAGTLITLLVAAYLQALSRRAVELAHTNALLTADIAARKKIEHALAESEERFRRLTDMSSDWYWEQDAQFRFTMVSGDHAIGGLPVKELIGKTRWDLSFNATDEEWAIHRQLLESRQPFTDIEYRIIDGHNRTHWIAINGEPLFDANGVFSGYRGTAKEITERKEAERALRQSQKELRELAAYQERVKEDERKRIAREIHDDLGQNLLALRIDVTLLETHAATANPALRQKVRLVLNQIDATVKSVRAIINNLRPPVLDLGMRAAIEWLAQQFRERSGIACSFHVLGEKFDFAPDDERATAIFRIVQESLANVIRHAQATRVDITLQRTGGRLFITIVDNGIGVFPGNARKPRSFGLIGIKERILSLGGEFNVDSIPGQGTRLALSIAADEPVLQACIGMQ